MNKFKICTVAVVAAVAALCLADVQAATPVKGVISRALAALTPVPHVTDATFKKEVEQSTLPVLVDFYAPWCGPCKTLAPLIEKAEKQYKGKLKVVKVNTDNEPALSTRFGITSIPTLIIFKNGKPIVIEVGGKTWAQLEKMIDDALKTP